MISHILIIGIFGGLGALCRYWISLSIQADRFPWATFIINVSGCFLLGAWLGFLKHPLFSQTVGAPFHPLTTGFLSGFTTFSTFCVEFHSLRKEKNPGIAVSYLSLSILLGFGLLVIGFLLGSQFPAPR